MVLHKDALKEGIIETTKQNLRERILRKTFEVIDRPLVPLSKSFRKRRRSPIYAKCEDFMEQLWEDGYQKEIPWKDLRSYVELVCGAFRTTVTDYLGKRATYYKGRGRSGVLRSPAKHGYLEKFGFIKLKSPKIVILLHENVDRPYHYKQTNIVDFSLSNSAEGNERTEGAAAPTNTTTLLLHTQSEREIKESWFRNTNQTRKKRLNESILSPRELRILGADAREGG